MIMSVLYDIAKVNQCFGILSAVRMIHPSSVLARHVPPPTRHMTDDYRGWIPSDF